MRTRDAERDIGATDDTDGGRLVGRGSSVDRHSQFVRQLVLLSSCEECGDGVCSRAQVAFSLEPGHPTHLVRRVRWGPDGAGEVAMQIAARTVLGTESFTKVEWRVALRL